MTRDLPASYLLVPKTIKYLITDEVFHDIIAHLKGHER